MALHADFPVGNSNHEWTAQFKQAAHAAQFYPRIMMLVKSCKLPTRVYGASAANPNVRRHSGRHACGGHIFMVEL